MYPLVGGTIIHDGSSVQVLVFRNGLVSTMNMETRQGDYTLVRRSEVPDVAARLVDVLTSEPNLMA